MMSNYISKNYESLVLDIINEYLDRNRTFEVDKILPFIHARFSKASINLNKNGIFNVIKTLINKKILVEGSKFTKERVLQNQNRIKLFESIMKNPGISFNLLGSKLDLSAPILEWHLNILLKFEYIRKVKIENRDAFFLFDKEFDNKELLHFFSREKYLKIIEYLKWNREGVVTTHLSAQLGMHPTTIKKYVKKLEEFRILYKKELPNKTLYFLNEELYNKLKEAT